jgi:hypothetical protein
MKTAEQLTCPLWLKACGSPTIEVITNFCNAFDLEYMGIDRRQEEPNQFWFQWSGEIPGTWVRVKFTGQDSHKPTWLLINAILDVSRMSVVFEFELEEDLDPDQLETALAEVSLIAGFG